MLAAASSRQRAIVNRIPAEAFRLQGLAEFLGWENLDFTSCLEHLKSLIPRRSLAYATLKGDRSRISDFQRFSDLQRRIALSLPVVDEEFGIYRTALTIVQIGVDSDGQQSYHCRSPYHPYF